MLTAYKADDLASELIHEASEDRRYEHRSRLILRAGRIATEGGVSMCLVVNISDGGMKIRTLLPLKKKDVVTVELTEDIRVKGRIVWCEGDRAGVQFFEKVDSVALLFDLTHNAGQPRHRALRLECDALVTLRTQGSLGTARLRNISLRGAMLETERSLAPGQLLDIAGGGAYVAAAVRWIRDQFVGVQFLQAASIETLRKLAGR